MERDPPGKGKGEGAGGLRALHRPGKVPTEHSRCSEAETVPRQDPGQEDCLPQTGRALWEAGSAHTPPRGPTPHSQGPVTCFWVDDMPLGHHPGVPWTISTGLSTNHAAPPFREEGSSRFSSPAQEGHLVLGHLDASGCCPRDLSSWGWAGVL